MFLSQIPTWAYIAAIVAMELLAFWWYRSSVKRGKKENVSIQFEKVTFIAALVLGALGLITLLSVNLALSQMG